MLWKFSQKKKRKGFSPFSQTFSTLLFQGYEAHLISRLEVLSKPSGLENLPSGKRSNDGITVWCFQCFFQFTYPCFSGVSITCKIFPRGHWPFSDKTVIKTMVSSKSGKFLLTLYQTTNFRLFQTQRVCRRLFQIWQKWVENTVGKWEIALNEQFLLFPQCFQKACFSGASKGVTVWEWVKDPFVLIVCLQPGLGKKVENKSVVLYLSHVRNVFRWVAIPRHVTSFIRIPAAENWQKQDMFVKH